MTDHVNWRYICGQDDDSFASFLDGLDDILDSSSQALFSIEMSCEFEDLFPQGIVGKWVSYGRVVKILSLFNLHVDMINFINRRNIFKTLNGGLFLIIIDKIAN